MKVDTKIHKVVFNLLPKCPPQDMNKIIEKLQRSYELEGWKSLYANDPRKAVLFYTVAHIRHNHTPYDTLLKLKPRNEARADISHTVKTIIASWGLKDYKEKEEETQYPDNIVIEGVNKNNIVRLRNLTPEELKKKRYEEIERECSKFLVRYKEEEPNRNNIRRLK